MARRYRPALPPSGKACGMTRQIALGAVIAFTVTVLVLSVWEPKPPVAAPAPAPAAVAPAPVAPAFVRPPRPATLRPEAINRVIRQPMMLQVIDAGASTP